MRNRINRLLHKLTAGLLVAILAVGSVPMKASAAPLIAHKYTTEDPLVVVSVGDSFSSGEGVPPFYGEKYDQDWLAHRSQKSWPGKLVVKDGSGASYTMEPYKLQPGTNHASPKACKWYFVAASGAETKHFTEKQKKVVHHQILSPKWLDPQQDVFDKIKNSGDTVDYVTMTIGGNDVGFSDIITTCATFCSNVYVGKNPKLQDQLDDLWDDIDIYMARLESTYNLVWDKIKYGQGEISEPHIIVAGYPELLNYDGKGGVINADEAARVNSSVRDFNARIEQQVNALATNKKNISFVDVATEFEGHQAYTEDGQAWLNSIKWGPRTSELQWITAASSYSIHPNGKGVEAYARCVNKRIEEIEAKKTVGSLSGRVCEAANRDKAVTNATINVYKDENRLSNEIQSEIDGHYRVTLRVPDGSSERYRVVTKAPGYLDFIDYANVKAGENTYLPVYLMIKESNAVEGTAAGCIKNALTGRGVGEVMLTVRKGWNNTDDKNIYSSIMTDSSGRYSIKLPLGNYTICAEKDGYLSGTVNIVVQEGVTPNQDGTISPIVSGDDYQIILEWGANPRDLDSHVVGSLTNGNRFHVYYADRSQYDGDVEVCNLDVDEVHGFGPETITLSATNAQPYYYYIYRYAGSGTVASSGAHIKINQGNRSIGEFYVPTDQGGGDYWNVFAIVDGKMIVRNTMTYSADLSYADPVPTMLSVNSMVAQSSPAFDDRYPAKEAPKAEDPTEGAPVGKEPAVHTESVPQTAFRKLYLDLSAFGTDYTWKVVAAENLYDVTEVSGGVYSVELPAEVTAMTLLADKVDGTRMTSAEITLADVAENTCIIPVAVDSTFEVIWGLYDPETGAVTGKPKEPVEEDPAPPAPDADTPVPDQPNMSDGATPVPDQPDVPDGATPVPDQPNVPDGTASDSDQPNVPDGTTSAPDQADVPDGTDAPASGV